MSGRARLPNKRKGRGKNEWRILLLILVPVCVFANTAFGGFVFDDREAIENNPDVRLDTPLSVLFKNDFWGTSLLDPESHKSYRPLTTLTFRWNHQLHGMKPSGYHLVNIFLHSFVCVLLYGVFIQVGVDQDTSLVASLLFAVHPIHTEAVANIVGRAEILSSVFYLLSISSFLRFHSSFQRSNNSRITRWWSLPYPWVFLTLVLALAAMLSKEQGVTCLGVCLICDLFIVCRLRLSAFPLIKCSSCAKGTLLPNITNRLSLLVILISLVGLLVFRFTIIQGQTPAFTESDNPASHSSSLKTRFLTFSYLCFFNFWLLVCPSRLCFDWSMGSVPLVDSFCDWRNLCTVFLFILILPAVGSCVIKSFTVLRVKDGSVTMAISDPGLKDGVNRPLPHPVSVLFALSLMILPFLPASNLFFTVGFVIAERVLYMPSMGFCLLVALGMSMLKSNAVVPGMCGKKPTLATTSLMTVVRQAVPSVLLLLLLVLSIKTVLRNAEWRDDETLALSGLRTNPLNAKIHATLGNSLAQKGDRRCEGYYREALRLKPDYPMAWANLGLVLLNIGKPKEAEKCYLKALSVQPDHINGNTNMGHLCRLQGRWCEALNYFSTASNRRPNNPMLLYYTGLMHMECGDSKLAEEKLDAALKLKPDYPEVYFAMGKLLSSKTRQAPAVHQRAKAISYLKTGLSLSPGYAEGHLHLGMLLSQEGRYNEAEIHFQKFLKDSPDKVKGHLELAQLYDRLGNRDKAKKERQKADLS